MYGKNEVRKVIKKGVKMRRFCVVVFLLSVTAFISWGAFAEQITITTYYPAPYGVYKDLVAETLLVTNGSDDILIGGGTNNPSIELRDRDAAGNTPYIDFSNDSGVDYDMRIILTGNNNFEVRGGETRFIDNNGDPAVIRVGETWFCAP